MGWFSAILFLTVSLAGCKTNQFAGTAHKRTGAEATAIPGGPNNNGDNPNDFDTDTTGRQGGSTGGDISGGTGGGGLGGDDGAATGGGLGGGGDQTQGDIDTSDGQVAELALRCTRDNLDSVRVRGQGSRVKVRGQLCPQAYGDLSILFLLDVSGSMRNADPRRGLFGNTCGREKAVKSIVKKLRQDAGDAEGVKIGSVRFGTTASDLQATTALDRFNRNILDFFKSNLNYCDSKTSEAGWTNYEAAFKAAQRRLSGVSGNKVIYLISDGLPTFKDIDNRGDENDGDGSRKAAGLAAAKALRSAHSDLTINAVFLDTNGAARNQGAQNYLNQVTGDPSRVRFANDANQLAEKIVELAIPKIELQRSTITGSLAVEGGGSRNVKVERFALQTTGERTWAFETAPFNLDGSPGRTIRQVLTVSAKDLKGKTHSNRLRIDFTQ